MAKYIPIGNYKSKLVANYKFEETSGKVCVDSKGSYNGTYNGTTSIAGFESNARSFNGTSDYISINNPLTPSTKLSLKIRVKIQNIKSNHRIIFTNCINGGHNPNIDKGIYIYIHENSNKISFVMLNALGNYNLLAATNNICDGLWHDILFTWDGTTNSNGVKLYIDNLISPYYVGTSLVPNVTPNSASSLMGKIDTGFYDSNLDELEIYNDVIAYKDIEKIKIEDIKNIGECIKCRYTALTSGQVGVVSELGTTLVNPININSSPTPDGLFYWVYIGKDYLGRKKFIADRNIQNSISWDTLNSAGICSEKLIKLIKINDRNNDEPLIPPMTSNTCDLGTVSALTYRSAGAEPFRVFDNNPTTSWFGFDGTSNNTSMWIAFTFNKNTVISEYEFECNNSPQSYAPIKWNFEGSPDGVNWVILDSRDNETSNITIKRKYKCAKICTLKYYRLNILKTNGGQSFWTLLSSLQLFGMYNFVDSNNTSVRLLTGGTSATDTDNEWDQIIVNSTLGGTITAGDNNVWNWNGIKSYTSTAQNGGYNSYRVYRGGDSANYWNYTNGSGSTVGFRPVLLVENLIAKPVFTGNLLSSSIHTEDAILTGSIADINNPIQKIQYKILLNDVQIYPVSGYTELQNSPVSINYNVANSLLTQTNNKITIITNNESNKISSNDFYATLYNNAPNGILTLSNITTHSDNIELTGNITDVDLDKISYRILINDIETSMWSTFTNDPYVDYTISANDLIIGSNKITIEYKDNYKNVGLGNWTNTITRTNSIPIINCQYINGSIIGIITDPDSDSVQYRILINGTQKYPETQEYSNLEQVANVDYQINRNDILMGKNNIITIFAKDSLNSSVGQEISFMGDYVGLMFMDEQKKYYSTDIGELLKYLDFGTITLGQITEPVKILVQNKYGFKIKDINLNVNSTLPNINIEFSKEENPFIATDKLILEKEYAINEIDYFYIRLSTSVSSNSVNGMFKITAKATPLA